METQDPPLPFDTKSSWLVLVCASVANCICMGPCFMYGIFFPSILDEFEVGKAKAGNDQNGLTYNVPFTV